MGKPVRASSFKLCHGCGRELGLVCIARVTLRFGEGLVTKHCHDLMRRASGLGKPSSSSLAQAVWLAVERKTSGSDRITHPLAEAIDREWLAVLGVDDRHMVALGGGEGFAVDASLIAADANKRRSIPGSEWNKEPDAQGVSRATKEYLATLDDAAFGAASDVTPKFVSPSDPAAQWTGAMRGAAFFAYADNYLIDVKFGVIMDVEASRAIRQAEVHASKTMIERTEQRFDIKPEWLAADTAYGSGANLNWLIKDKKIAPHVPVIDKSNRDDGTFIRQDFTFDEERNVYICPAGKVLTTTGRLVNDGETTLLYFASVLDCRSCRLKERCCPKVTPRRIPRSIYEEARDVARALAKTRAFEQSRRDRKRVEMLFAHLKRILRLGRLRLRGPRGAQFEFTLAAIAQNLRRLAKLVARPPPSGPIACVA